MMMMKRYTLAKVSSDRFVNICDVVNCFQLGATKSPELSVVAARKIISFGKDYETSIKKYKQFEKIMKLLSKI